MNILITGGCGFIGSNFTRSAKKDSRFKKIINLDCLYPCATRSSDLTENTDNYVFVKGNINDQKLVLNLLIDHQIDLIVHFAAQSHVDTSFSNPLQYTEDNVLGTHNLLEACRSYGKLYRFIHISTDEVYGENDDNNEAKTELSILNPSNPYSASKAAAEMFVNSYINSYKFPAIIIRSNNIYGEGQYPVKVLPKFIQQIRDGTPITIQGSGNQQRSFLYIDDIVSAVLCVIDKGIIGQIYNISSECEISINQLAKMLLKLLKPRENPETHIITIPDRPFNDKRYFIKSDKLEALGWKQTIKFPEGLKKTLNWYLNTNTSDYWIETF